MTEILRHLFSIVDATGKTGTGAPGNDIILFPEVFPPNRSGIIGSLSMQVVNTCDDYLI